MKSLTQALADLARTLGVNGAYILGRSGGEVRILVSAAIWDDDIRNAAIQLAERGKIHPEEFKKEPIREIDPVGGLIAERPFIRRGEDDVSSNSEDGDFIALWDELGLAAAFDLAAVNPVHKDWGQKLASLIWKMIRKFADADAIDPIFFSQARKEPLPKVVFDWLKPLRYVLHTLFAYYDKMRSECSPEGIVHLIALCRDGVPKGRRESIPPKGLRTQLPGKRLNPDLPMKLARLRHLTDADRERVIESFQHSDEQCILDDIDTPTFEEVLASIGNTDFGGHSSVTRKSSGGSDLYISPACGRFASGHNAFANSSEAALCDWGPSNLEAAVVVACNFLFVRPEDIASLVVDRARLLIGRKNLSYPDDTPDQEVHQPSDPMFWLPAPEGLLNIVEALQAAESKPDENRVNEYLGRVGGRNLTLARCRRYLLFNGCVRSGFGPILPRCGLYAYLVKADVARTYVHLTGPHYAGYIKWLGQFFPGWNPNLENIPFNGSAFCASPEVVREMWDTRQLLLKAPLPSPLQDLVSHYNAAAALTHLLAVVLLAGCRNYPTDLPQSLLRPWGWIINYEKQVFGLHLPEPSRACIEEFLEFKKRASRAFRDLGIDHHAIDESTCALIEIPESKTPVSLPIKWANLRDALVAHGPTWRFSLLSTNALRHLSMTLLYGTPGITHHEIEAFHQRAIGRSSPLSAGFLGDSLLRATREKCSQTILRALFS